MYRHSHPWRIVIDPPEVVLELAGIEPTSPRHNGDTSQTHTRRRWRLSSHCSAQHSTPQALRAVTLSCLSSLMQCGPLSQLSADCMLCGSTACETGDNVSRCHGSQRGRSWLEPRPAPRQYPYRGHTFDRCTERGRRRPQRSRERRRQGLPAGQWTCQKHASYARRRRRLL